METLYELIKKHSEGKGEDVMWKTVKVVSEAVEDNMSPDERRTLIRDIYGEMSHGHYDEEFAMMDVKDMYYTDESGERHYAPYWSPEQIKPTYEKVKAQIPDYNMWDWFVLMQMQKSDMYPLLKKWYPNGTPEEMTEKVIELSVNWLKDEDLECTSKVWRYLDAMK